jgi:hypothetical protein
MLAQHAATPQSPRRIGVGIDTSRYGGRGTLLSGEDHFRALQRDEDKRSDSIRPQRDQVSRVARVALIFRPYPILGTT